MTLIDILFLYKNCLLIHAAFFLLLLRISMKNLDRRLDRLERHMNNCS